MRKRVFAGLAVLCLAIVGSFGCCKLWSRAVFEERTIQHISDLTSYGQNIYFGAGNCLYCLDTQDQTLRELECIGGRSFGGPAVDGENAYAQQDEFLVAVDLSAQQTSWRVNESQFGHQDFLHHRNHIYLINNKIISTRTEGTLVYDTLGKLMWHTEFDEMDRYLFQAHDSLVWYIADRLGQESGRMRLEGLDLDTGDVLQTVDLPLDIEFDRLLYVDDTWIVVRVTETHEQYHIGAVERAQSRQIAWISEALCVHCDIVIYDDLFVIHVGDTGVYALDVYTGQVMWKFNVYVNNVAGDNVERIIPLLLRAPNLKLYGVDSATGAKIWEYDLKYGDGSHGVTAPVVIAGAVYIGNRDSIDALDLETGKLLWQVEVDSSYSFLVSRSGL
jgi:outer membrane protein assembly factor BamB